jgi:hypothetical protein
LSTSSVIPGLLTTSVPQIQFTPQGPIIPDDTDILAGVQIDMNYAFGGGLNPALNTPQGQLASSTAAIIADKDAEIALIVNQMDPQYATGRFQDGIGRIYFIDRIGATTTAVACSLTGPGGIVPPGSLAQDTSGNTYSLLGTVTIPAGGTVIGSFQNVITGPIPCPAGTLTQVYQAVPGWDAITNPADGVLGQNVETPAEFELRRQNTVAGNSRGSTQAILSNIFNTVPNILDCYVFDNTKGQTVFKGSTNYPLLPHSLYVAVVGGIDADIAQAIWIKKDTGCDYNGNTTVVVLDTSPQYSAPFPAYPVQFNRPTATPVLFAVQIVNSTTLPANIVALIQNAIIAQFNGLNPAIPPARIASAITGANYYGAVIGAAQTVTVLSVLVGITAATLTQVTMGIDQSPVISAADITVTLV